MMICFLIFAFIAIVTRIVVLRFKQLFLITFVPEVIMSIFGIFAIQCEVIKVLNVALANITVLVWSLFALSFLHFDLEKLLKRGK